MNEKMLLRIAFVISLAGMLALFLIFNATDYDEKTIEMLNDERIDSMIKLKGKVQSIRNAGNVTFVSVEQPNYMDVVIFDNISLQTGDQIEIIGNREEYENKMEVIAHRIRVIR